MSDFSGEKPSCDQIINILPDPFVVIARDYRIVSANNSYLKHYGYECARDVVGRYCYEVSHHRDSPCSGHGEQCPLETVFETGNALHVMHLHFEKEGGEQYVQLHSTPLFDEQGKVRYVAEQILPVSQRGDDSLLLGRSRPMLRLISLLQRVAQTPTTVLLLGESGVGKECVAQYVHQYSTRSGMPFVILDCGTLGENLIESELFGYEKGAFTGAAGRKKGLFEAANGGTLFIDEIAELPLPLQTKLLRVLESGTIRRIGGTDYIRVDVRVIAATNKDLQSMVERGAFREDLYYRLSAFPVTVPSLRERPDDIPALAEHFLAKIEEGDRHLPLSSQVMEALLGYDYPGNVRELRNVIERANILSYGQVMSPDHIVFEGPRRPSMQQVEPESMTENSAPASSYLDRRLGRLTQEQVRWALEQYDGHRAKAARLLGVSERTLYRYVQRLRR